MKNRYLFLFLLLGLFGQHLNAKPISKSEASVVAKEFFKQGRNVVAPLRFKETSQRAMNKLGSQTSLPEYQPFYVFNVENEEGFVIVSGEDAFADILGYSDTGSFDMENAPEGLKQWMDVYSAYIKVYQQKKVSVLANNRITKVGQPLVQPLLKEINWGQDYPFNEKCPTYSSGGKNIHYYTGCVAAAATQIMRYYNYPEQGTGSKSYTYKGNTYSADFGSTTYDWENMVDSYTDENLTPNQVDAVATLARDFGFAVEMQYDQAASGAFAMMVSGALRDYFGYDKGTRLCLRNYYSSSEWMALIKKELDAARPVYYSGGSDKGSDGHAFVCDGYDSNDYVHINWGWYGKSNGYFMINHLDPDDLGEGGGTGGYNVSQEIVVGIQPDTHTNAKITFPLYGSTRLAVSDYGSSLTLMTFIENVDTDPFNGSLSAVLVRDNQILKVLKEMPLSVEGFANAKSGSELITLRDVPLAASGIEDGKYQLRLGYKLNAVDDWQILRHSIGYPSYGNVSVTNDRILFEGMETLIPDVTLLEKVSTDGAIYAKGSALFRINLRNNSKNIRLKELMVHFQSKANPEIVGYSTISASVYDESSEQLNLAADLDESLPAGEYYVTIREKSYPDVIFDDSSVGRAEMTILPESTVPVIRLIQKLEWTTADASADILRGKGLYIAMGARNYGPAGNVALIAYLQDVNDPEKSYVLQQKSASIMKGKSFAANFYRVLPVDPGTYKVVLNYISEGQTLQVENAGIDDCILEVKEGNNVLLNVVSFDCPDEITKGVKTKASITFETSDQSYQGTVYLRVRQLTITNGEIIYMGSQTIPAHQQKKIDFNINLTDVVPGTYIVLVEAARGVEGTVSNYADCYKLITVKDNSSNIEALSAENEIKVYPIPVIDRLLIESSDEIDRMELSDIKGCLIRSWLTPDSSIDMDDIPSGVYLMKIIAKDKTIVKKIVKR